MFCFKARFPLDSKWGYFRTFLGRQFPGFKCERFRRHISLDIAEYCQKLSKIVRLKYQKFFYHQKMPLVKQQLG